MLMYLYAHACLWEGYLFIQGTFLHVENCKQLAA